MLLYILVKIFLLVQTHRRLVLKSSMEEIPLLLSLPALQSPASTSH